jgi:OOP family OmpA-OmpF porin
VASAAVEVGDGAVEVGEIPYRSGSDMLREDAVTRLETLAAFMRARTGVRRRVIEGHTDNAGDPEFNVGLSERRAARVRIYFIVPGLAPTRLGARGDGATRPLATNSTGRDRAQNSPAVLRNDRDFGATPGSALPEPHPPGPEEGR